MKTLRIVSVGLLIAFGSALASITAHSVEMPERGPIPFAVFDVDGNGQISQEEFNTIRDQRRAAKAAEGRPMRGAATAPSFEQLDTNGDGQLSPEELTAGQQAHRAQRGGMGMGRGMGM